MEPLSAITIAAWCSFVVFVAFFLATLYSYASGTKNMGAAAIWKILRIKEPLTSAWEIPEFEEFLFQAFLMNVVFSAILFITLCAYLTFWKVLLPITFACYCVYQLGLKNRKSIQESGNED